MSEVEARSAARLTNRTIIAYGLPGFAMSLVFVPLNSVVPGVYAKYFGLPLAFIGLSRLILGTLDGVSDVLTAYLSDLTVSRFGPRKPWIFIGAFVTAVGTWLTFMPISTSLAGKPGYYLGAAGLLYLGWTLVTVPYKAWGAEITGDYIERSRVATIASAVDAAGSLLFVCIPILLPFATEEMTPGSLWVIGLVGVILSPLLCTLAVVWVPTVPAVAAVDGRMLELAKSVIRNRPFQLYMAAFVLQGLALGIVAALIFLYIDGTLGLSERFARILLASMVAGLVSLPLWLRLVNRVGKHHAWGIGSVVTNVVLVALAFVPHGPAGYWPAMIIMALYGATGMVAAITVPSMMADIVDYDILKTGVNRTAVYFAFLTLTVKVTAAIGGFLAFVLLDWLGFDAREGAHNTAAAEHGMILVLFGLHSLLQLLALPFIWLSPITERRQRIIRRRVESRADRERRATLTSHE